MRRILIINIDGTQLTLREKRLLKCQIIAGVILFKNNYASKEQIKNLINDIKDINPNLFISIDHEGGRIQRFRDDFTNLPSFEMVSNISDTDQRKKIVTAMGFVAGYELKSIGVDINYSPVVDLNHNKNSKLLKDRTFGMNVNEVVSLSSLYINSCSNTGVLSVLKHFPGHGRVDTDTHTHFCESDVSLSTLLETDVIPFKNLHNKYKLPIMTNHISYSSVDNKICTYSHKILRDLSREIFDERPIFISDDLEMFSAKYMNEKYFSCKDRVLQALEAGCSYLICTTNLVSDINKYESSAEYFEKNYVTDEILDYCDTNHDKIGELEIIDNFSSNNILYEKYIEDLVEYKNE